MRPCHSGGSSGTDRHPQQLVRRRCLHRLVVQALYDGPVESGDVLPPVDLDRLLLEPVQAARTRSPSAGPSCPCRRRSSPSSRATARRTRPASRADAAAPVIRVDLHPAATPGWCCRTSAVCRPSWVRGHAVVVAGQIGLAGVAVPAVLQVGGVAARGRQQHSGQSSFSRRSAGLRLPHPASSSGTVS